MTEFGEIKKLLPGAQEQVPLANHTTFKIGGSARYFFVAKTSGDITNAVRAAKKLGLRHSLLSSGSNVLIADEGFPGLVIKIQNTKYHIRNTKVRAEAGVHMPTLVRETTRRGLAGLEWAGGLPGTLGGAIRGNAGAFGGEIKDVVSEVEALDSRGRHRTFSKKECKFTYRSSLFKEKGSVVLAATLRLEKRDKKKIQGEAADHIRYRKERHPLEYPNAGSIFKNCDVKKVPKKVAEEFADVIKQDPFPVIPTAALIAKARLQGLRVGGAVVSEKHPNYIVNAGNATAEDVLQLVGQIKKSVKKRFHVDLQEEITFPPH